MKRLSLLLLSIPILLCACKRVCPAYPTDKIAYAYAPFKYGGNVLTYCSTDGLDIIDFKCDVPIFSESNKQPYCAKCACELKADQILKSDSDSSTINYTHIINSIGEDDVDLADISNLYITGMLGETTFSVGLYWIDQEYLPEWTAVDGTRYAEVYRWTYDKHEDNLYLAPGYGIVQIETPDKTYYLKHENQ